MSLRHDLKLHLYGGIGTAAASAGVVEVGRYFGAPMAVATGGVLLWAFVEVYQWLRGNGKPELIDAILGAAPSVALGVALWWGGA